MNFDPELLFATEALQKIKMNFFFLTETNLLSDGVHVTPFSFSPALSQSTLQRTGIGLQVMVTHFEVAEPGAKGAL